MKISYLQAIGNTSNPEKSIATMTTFTVETDNDLKSLTTAHATKIWRHNTRKGNWTQPKNSTTGKKEPQQLKDQFDGKLKQFGDQLNKKIDNNFMMMQQTLLTSQNKMQDQLFKVLDHNYGVIVNLAAQVSTNMSIIQHNMVLQQKGSTLDKF